MNTKAAGVLLVLCVLLSAGALTVSILSFAAANQADTVPVSDYERLTGYVSDIRKVTDFKPEVAIVLGSGLGGFADKIDTAAVVPYSSLKGFPVSTVEGHAGNFVFGTIDGVKVVIMQGRIHYYEGYPISEVVLPVRLMNMLGAKTLIITNAVGSLNQTMQPGSFVAVKDHYSFLVPSPLIGKNIDELGERFTAMNDVYDEDLRKTVLALGKEHNIPVAEGIYMQIAGPQYETPAEVQLFRSWGFDTIGMSSAVEAIAAKHAGMRICMINCVTDMAAGIGGAVPNDDEVKKVANSAGENFEILVAGLVRSLKEQ